MLSQHAGELRTSLTVIVLFQVVLCGGLVPMWDTLLFPPGLLQILSNCEIPTLDLSEAVFSSACF